MQYFIVPCINQYAGNSSFKFMNFLSNNLTRVFAGLEKNQLYDTITKEVVGINTPRVAITRSANERLDVATFEAGNTIGSFGPTLLLDKYLKNKLYKPGMSEQAVKWVRLGHSAGVLFPLAGIMWAMPFIRNYITTMRTGKTNFSDVISKNNAGSAVTDDKIVSEKQKETLSKIEKILGISGALALAGIFGSKSAAAKNLKMGNIMEGIFKRFAFDKDKGFLGMGDWPTFVFWGVASYAGALMGARDKFEFKEMILKFFAFNFGFFVPKKVFKKVFEPRLRKTLGENLYKQVADAGEGTIKKANIDKLVANEATKKAASKLWLTRNILGLGTSIFLLGALPQVLNIFLTKKRLASGGTNPSGAQPVHQLKQVQNTHFQQFLQGVNATR